MKSIMRNRGIRGVMYIGQDWGQFIPHLLLVNGVGHQSKPSPQVHWPHPILHWRKLQQHLMSHPLWWRTHSFIKKKICALSWSTMERGKFSNWYICEEPCGQNARWEWHTQSLTKITLNVILDSVLRQSSDGLMSYQTILSGDLF